MSIYIYIHTYTYLSLSLYIYIYHINHRTSILLPLKLYNHMLSKPILNELNHTRITKQHMVTVVVITVCWAYES